MRPCPILSVVIPGYNNSELSSQVLQDVLRTADYQRHEFELIFVDDGSYDDTPAVVRAFGDQVIYLRHDQNRGVAPAWNTGVRACTGDFVVILNNDVRITDDRWMSKLVNAVAGRKAIAGPELVTYNAATEYNGRNQPYLNGWCYVFPRRIFDEIGLFEEAFAPASFEDVEFCTRAAAYGYELVEVPLRMQHAYSQTVNKFLRADMPALNARNRAIWHQRMGTYTKPRMRIVFDCPGNMQGGWEPWALEERGIGGSEQAITLLTRELASRGHDVHLFNDVPSTLTGSGVTYHPRAEIGGFLEADAFVTFRCPSDALPRAQAQRKVFWSCDQQTSGDWNRDIFPHVNAVVNISEYHRAYMAAAYSGVQNQVVIGCPIEHWRYEPHLDKDLSQFIFCSVPGRGLDYMKIVMAGIRQHLPEARLVITSDYRLWGAKDAFGNPDPRNNVYRVMFANEDFRGMVPRAELIQLQGLSMAYPYPCTYEECFCIAVAECAAAGAIPITTNIGAVAQTVGRSGVIVGPPTGDFAQQIAQATLEAYAKPELMLQAIEESWRWSAVRIGTAWETLLRGANVEAVPYQAPQFQWSARTPSGDIVSTRTTPNP